MCDKCQRLQCCRQLLAKLHGGVGPRIFLDEAKIELTPYTNSTKDWIIEVAAGVCGDLGMNKQCQSEGLMILGVFILDSRSWCHMAPAHMANVTQTCMSQCMVEVGGELLLKTD